MRISLVYRNRMDVVMADVEDHAGKRVRTMRIDELRATLRAMLDTLDSAEATLDAAEQEAARALEEAEQRAEKAEAALQAMKNEIRERFDVHQIASVHHNYERLRQRVKELEGEED